MSVTEVPLLSDLQGAWAALRIQLTAPAEPREALSLSDVYPFTSVTDLKRMLWIQRGGDPRWSPERVFLGVRSAGGIRPLEFHWPTSVMGGPDVVDLPYPTAATRAPSAGLVDAAGNRLPVGPTMIGSLILEAALSPEIIAGAGTLPTIEAISLASLAADLTAETLTSALFAGFFQLYYPWLTAPAQVLDAASTTMTSALRDAYAACLPYIEDRTGRISVVQRALSARVGGASVAMTTMVRLRWVLPPPAARPTSLEKTFYSLRAGPVIPFLRFFPSAGAGAGSAPLLKLGLKEDGSPIIDDARVFAQYINQPAPNTKSAVILARVPMRSAHVERGAAFVLHMFEDGTVDISLEVPQRGATYIAVVAADAQRLLREVLVSIGFSADTVPILRDLHATYKWTHPDPRRAAPLSAARLKARVEALTPFLDPIPVVAETAALAAFQWRAVSNYESESAQFAYITQMVLRPSASTTGGAGTGAPGPEPEGIEALQQFIGELSDRFGLTREAANTVLERWLERRGAAVAPAPGISAGIHAVPRHSTGASVSVSGTHPEYFLEIQGVDSMEELQRLLSVMGVLLGAATTDLTIRRPAPAVEAVGAAVGMADMATVEAAGGVAEAAGAAALEEGAAADVGEMDPALAALLGDLGIDMGMGGLDAEAEEEGLAGAAAPAPELVAAPALIVEEAGGGAAEAAVAPNLEAAMAAVEEECRGTRWTPGEAPVKLKADWYMARLKKHDTVLFGYKVDAAGRTKSYSKSCQRRDGRQPNIMTLSEYARVKRCYEEKVRFVDLPPRKPEDLPNDPDYNPKPRTPYPDEYFLTDPETGRPMWTVYGYENRTRPGEFLYLMCSELWCERDNLPLLRAEFEGMTGRGFSKPPNTCPFCGGTEIGDMAAPVSGESVIVRGAKESTGKLHGFIGTIQRNKHPRGYPLPCCDTTPRLLKKYLEANALGRIVWGRDLAVDEEEEGAEGGAAGGAGAAAAAEDYAEPEPELAAIETGAGGEEVRIDYGRLFGSMNTHYILGNDKTLTAGKIGLLTPLLDSFFGQNGPRSLESRGIRPTFVEGATVFVRMGVDTRMRAPGLNLFAGLAPLLGFESAEQTRNHILTRRMVRAFESANYGNLVHEFAAASTQSDAAFEKSLTDFASEFRYPLDAARPHVVRLYKAWVSYLTYLNDQRKPKQLRHLEHLLAQPGVITPRGLLLIVLEQNGDRIEVACPAFGIPPASVFGDVPVAFMWHDKRDESWEPIVLYNGTRNAVIMFGERTPELELVPRHLRSSLQRWIREWRSSSLGCGRPSPPPHVWSPARDTSGLPRLTQLRHKMSVAALVRDRSNRLAGVLVTTGSGGGGGAAAAAGPQVFVPCLDDGALADSVSRVYEAEMIPSVGLDVYLRVYEDLAAEFAGLRPVRLLTRMSDSTSTIVGFATAAGAMVPTEPLPSASKPAGAPAAEQQLDAFPWERDALILRAPDAAVGAAGAADETSASVEEQLAEAYQHVRLSLSYWLLRDARGPALRDSLATLIRGNLPLYEKRKRADILLEPIIREFVATEQTDARRSLSLLRQDCLVLPEAQCAGACRWSGDRCLIHAPVREEGSDPIRVFAARLSDEILRYSAKQRELFDQHVPEIRVPRGIVRTGDELYMAIKPKESALAVMERLGFTGEAPTAFPEEMLRFDGLEEAPGVEAVVAVTEGELPPAWREKGFAIPQVAPDLEDGRRLAFAGVTGRAIGEWETAVQGARVKLGLSGDAARPLQWSIQDFYTIANIRLSNILFVRLSPTTGLPTIQRWIAPAPIITAKMKDPLYMIFWGPGEVLVHRGKDYRFLTRDLPLDLLAALDAASPMTDAEARGGPPEAEAAPALIMAAAAAGGVTESKGGEEAAPKLTVTEVQEL
jgi:hypothetical protein